jgi:hypothetical protein
MNRATLEQRYPKSVERSYCNRVDCLDYLLQPCQLLQIVQIILKITTDALMW